MYDFQHSICPRLWLAALPIHIQWVIIVIKGFYFVFAMAGVYLCNPLW